MRPVGTTKQLEQRRRKAYEKFGEQAFEAHSPPGRTPGLSQKQKNRLVKLLLKGASRHSYPTELWTLQRVAEVIDSHFGIRYDLSSVWHILKGMGWSCQKPERRARERDEKAIALWRKKDWPRIKKSPKKR